MIIQEQILLFMIPLKGSSLYLVLYNCTTEKRMLLWAKNTTEDGLLIIPLVSCESAVKGFVEGEVIDEIRQIDNSEPISDEVEPMVIAEILVGQEMTTRIGSEEWKISENEILQ